MFHPEILTTDYADDTDELLRMVLEWTAGNILAIARQPRSLKGRLSALLTNIHPRAKAIGSAAQLRVQPGEPG